MNRTDKARIIGLQKQIKIAREALREIGSGCRDHEVVAEEALDAMQQLDPPPQLQGICGHGNPSS